MVTDAVTGEPLTRVRILVDVPMNDPPPTSNANGKFAFQFYSHHGEQGARWTLTFQKFGYQDELIEVELAQDADSRKSTLIVLACAMRPKETSVRAKEYVRRMGTTGILDLRREAFGKDVGDVDLEPLAEVSCFHTLYLTGTGVTDKGLESLAELSELQNLYLNETSITDQGLVALAKLPRLRKLDLSQTNITDEGLSKLTGMFCLQSVDLGGTKVTAKGIERMRNESPRLQVRWK